MANKTVTIKPPSIQVAEFELIGDIPSSPLVIRRFSLKSKDELRKKMEMGSAASSRRKREAAKVEQLFEEARYRSPEGWDGFHVGAIRAGMISACRLVNFKMTLAKLSVFVEPDGCDHLEPQIQLIRILDAEPRLQQDVARVSNGEPYVAVRAAYHNWRAMVRIRWDADQFTLEDVTNLLMRVGMQVGIGEGRPDSKSSGGMGWGLFRLGGTKK